MLDTLFGSKRRASSARSDPWTTGSGRVTRAGATVDEETALTYSAVWCATRLICETAASLPLFLYQRDAHDDRSHAKDHPLYAVLKSAPNPQMTSMAFREGRLLHQVNYGNAFAEIERTVAGSVAALWPIHPSRVRPAGKDVRTRDGRPVEDGSYLVKNNDNTSVVVAPSEMLHVPGVLSEDGVWGKGVVSYARESIGFGLATEAHGAALFGSGGQPKGIVYGTGLKDKEARTNFRREWRELHGSPNSVDIAILPTDAKYEKLTFSNEDNQFLQSRKHNILEIARWYRVPAHMLSELMGPAGYNSVEMFSQEFVTYSLLPWLKRWEEQCNLKLLTPDERREYYVEHQLASLLRGDLTTRYNAYRTGIMTGWLNLNEVRRFEGLNGIGPDGEVYFFPMNMSPIEDAAAPQEDAAQPPAEPGSDQSGSPDDGMDNQSSALRDAARAVLASALAWVFTKESNAAKRAANNKDFDRWLAEFYRDHADIVEKALTPGLGVLACAGAEASPALMARRLAAESRAELLAAYDTDTPDQFAARLSLWPTVRAAAVADKILAGGYADV
jgi:HK97 family phage portal protein